MSLDNYTHILQNLLQSRVKFKCNNKTFKQGKLTLFNAKQYFFKFNIETEKDSSKTLELPYPFEISYNKVTKICTLNYMLTALYRDKEILRRVNRIDSQQSSKFYNNIIYIVPFN